MAEDEPELRIVIKKEVCPCCRGRGTTAFGHHADEALVFTSDDMLEDPEFAEAYVSRAYDKRCPECKGANVIDTLDEGLSNPLAVELWNEWLQDAWEDANVTAMERAMGA